MLAHFLSSVDLYLRPNVFLFIYYLFVYFFIILCVCVVSVNHGLTGPNKKDVL